MENILVSQKNYHSGIIFIIIIPSRVHIHNRIIRTECIQFQNISAILVFLDKATQLQVVETLTHVVLLYGFVKGFAVVGVAVLYNPCGCYDDTKCIVDVVVYLLSCRFRL